MDAPAASTDDFPQQPSLDLQRYTLSMKIFLNGQSHECASATTVASLLADTGHGERRVAVEVNREIVPRSRHVQHELHDGDRVEIVQAIGGG